MVQVHVKAISCRFKSCYPHHVGAKESFAPFFFGRKTSARFLASSFSQKDTLGLSVQL